MKEFFKLWWKDKFVWQVWLRIIFLIVIIPLTLVGILGKICESLIDFLNDTLPSNPNKCGNI
jgi:hypothetical protein